MLEPDSVRSPLVMRGRFGATGICEHCPAGLYGDATGLSASVCTGQCQVGRFGGPGATTDACTGPCAAGFFCPAGSSTPMAVRACHTQRGNRALWFVGATWPLHCWDAALGPVLLQYLLHIATRLCGRGCACFVGSMSRRVCMPRSSFRADTVQCWLRLPCGIEQDYSTAMSPRKVSGDPAFPSPPPSMDPPPPVRLTEPAVCELVSWLQVERGHIPNVPPR